MHSRDDRRIPGIKRPFLILPESLTGKQSFCITIPDGLSNKLVLIDLLSVATLWFNWQRTDGTDGKIAADAWRDSLNLPELKMCCCPQPTNRRYNADGQLEVSYDNGATWVTDPTADDRFSGIISPPLSGADGAEKRCVAATSAQEYIKDNLIDSLTTGMTYAELNGTGIALAALLGVTGVGILIAAFAAAAFLAGIVAVQAAFTSEVWADFKCILYCAINPDGSFSAAGWEEVKSEILSSFTGVVSAILYNWVNSVGSVGLTNAARSGWAAAGDCDACDCANEWCYEFDFTASDGGWVTDFGNWVSGNGWTGVAFGTGGGLSNLRTDFPGTASLTSITVHSVGSGFTVGQRQIDLQLGSDPVQHEVLSPDVNGDQTGVFHQFDFTPFDDDRIALFWGGAGSFDIVIDSVIFSGIGTNPFGADNCV